MSTSLVKSFLSFLIYVVFPEGRRMSMMLFMITTRTWVSKKNRLRECGSVAGRKIRVGSQDSGSPPLGASLFLMFKVVT
jgi:hypothetical protein